MFWQLMTAPAVLTVMVRVVEPLLMVSTPPGHCDRSGPVFAGPGQPQASRFCQTLFLQSTAPTLWANARKASAEIHPFFMVGLTLVRYVTTHSFGVVQRYSSLCFGRTATVLKVTKVPD